MSKPLDHKNVDISSALHSFLINLKIANANNYTLNYQTIFHCIIYNYY